MSDEIILISDEALKEQVIDALPGGYKPIRKSELETLSDLTLHFCNLNELHFLTHCKKLKSLSFLQEIDNRPFHKITRIAGT